MSRKIQRIPIVFVYVLLIGYGATTVLPFVTMLLSSFRSTDSIMEFPPKFPDLLFTDRMWDNYKEVLIDRGFWRNMANSLFVAVTASLGQLMTCSMAAFAFARMNFWGKGLVFAVLIATLMVPSEVTIIPEFLLFARLGWLNTFAPLIVPSLLVGSFGTFMLKEFYGTVPKGLEEAAAIDGSTPFRTYLHIFLPISAAPMSVLFIIAFMNSWNELLRPVLYITSPALKTVTQGLREFQSVYTTQWSLLLTATVAAALPVIIVYLFNQRFILESMMHSGVKG